MHSLGTFSPQRSTDHDDTNNRYHVERVQCVPGTSLNASNVVPCVIHTTACEIDSITPVCTFNKYLLITFYLWETGFGGGIPCAHIREIGVIDFLPSA